MPKTVIWETWCLHFGTLWDHFGTSGAPWETVEAAGRTCGGLESTFYGFRDDLRAPFKELFGHGEVTYCFCFWARFQS